MEDLSNLAFYFAKWEVSGLGIKKETLLEMVGGKNDLQSFTESVEIFRCVLFKNDLRGLKGSPKLTQAYSKLKNKTISQVRGGVLITIKEIKDYE